MWLDINNGGCIIHSNDPKSTLKHFYKVKNAVGSLRSTVHYKLSNFVSVSKSVFSFQYYFTQTCLFSHAVNCSGHGPAHECTHVNTMYSTQQVLWQATVGFLQIRGP